MQLCLKIKKETKPKLEKLIKNSRQVNQKSPTILLIKVILFLCASKHFLALTLDIHADIFFFIKCPMALPTRFFTSLMTLFRKISVEHRFGNGKKAENISRIYLSFIKCVYFLPYNWTLFQFKCTCFGWVFKVSKILK